MRFVDTNVLLYTISTAESEAEKRLRADAILADADLGLSVQVLQEFYVQATRPSRDDAITHEQAVGLVEAWCRFPVQEITVGVMAAALGTRGRFGISYRDAAVVEAARALGCAVVLSEDLSPETDYGGVRVENPFAT